MSNVSVFRFAGKAVRTVDGADGALWFALSDVCQALGSSNASFVVRRIDEADKDFASIYTSGGAQRLRIINESGLFKLVLSSRHPAGKAAVKVLISQLSDAKSVLNALNDFEVPDDLPGMFVYAIRNTVTGNVKLGISRNPAARLKQLQTGNDCTLELVATREALNRFADEHALHIENAATRVNGEWFAGVEAGSVLN